MLSRLCWADLGHYLKTVNSEIQVSRVRRASLDSFGSAPGGGSLIVEGEWGLLCVEGYLRRVGTTCFALQALKAGTEAAESSMLSRVSHSRLAL